MRLPACRALPRAAGRAVLRRAVAPVLMTWTALLAAAGCSPTLDWRELRATDGRVIGLLPCRPAQQARTVRLAGAEVALTVHACRAGDVVWAIAEADVGDPARVGPALAGLRAAATANVGAGASRALPFDVRGATPNPSAGRVAFDGALPDGRPVQQQQALFAFATRVFQATCVGTALPTDGVETFFAGLRAPA